jgi:leucyl-tRNA synthetase
LLLAPITPHISHELWNQLGHIGAIIDAPWPTLDDSALIQDTLQLVIQVNGKLRGQIDMPAGASREDSRSGGPHQRKRAALHRRPDHPQSDRRAG